MAGAGGAGAMRAGSAEEVAAPAGRARDATRSAEATWLFADAVGAFRSTFSTTVNAMRIVAAMPSGIAQRVARYMGA